MNEKGGACTLSKVGIGSETVRLVDEGGVTPVRVVARVIVEVGADATAEAGGSPLKDDASSIMLEVLALFRFVGLFTVGWAGRIAVIEDSVDCADCEPGAGILVDDELGGEQVEV